MAVRPCLQQMREMDLSLRPILYCIPYAGGDVSVYHPWIQQLKDVAEVRPVQLPGRGRLIGEQLCTSVTEMVRWLGENLDRPYGRSIVLFGHSMGALIAYELARAWQRERVGQLERLIVSGYSGAHLHRRRAPMHQLDDASLLRQIGELDGTPPALLSNPDLMQFFLPILRADFQVCETYVHLPFGKLDVPILALSGEQDKDHPPAAVNEWAAHTRDHFEKRVLPGGHFFVNTHGLDVMELLRQALSRRSDAMAV